MCKMSNGTGIKRIKFESRRVYVFLIQIQSESDNKDKLLVITLWTLLFIMYLKFSKKSKLDQFELLLILLINVFLNRNVHVFVHKKYLLQIKKLNRDKKLQYLSLIVPQQRSTLTTHANKLLKNQ